MRRVSSMLVLAAAGALAGCVGSPTVPTESPSPSTAAMLAAIHAAGRRDDSVLSITPLRPRALTLLLQQARSQTIKGNDQATASLLAQARQEAPDDPEVLQLQAENAIRLHDYSRAERLARQSWSSGAKLGALCARNWQTVAEMRRLAHDASGVAEAARARAQCEKEAIKRM